jgi:hypothetical protein
VDKLSDVILLALPGKAVDQLQLTGIVASDGYKPGHEAELCEQLPGRRGEALAGLHRPRDPQDLWDAALAMPGCTSVTDAAELLVADK